MMLLMAFVLLAAPAAAGPTQVGCLTLLVPPAQVKRVLDGDTFALYHVGVEGEEVVRVLGVDTPERTQPKWREATAFTEGWLKRGPFQLIACQRDKYGRLLATVTRQGEPLAEALDRAGLAKPE